MAKSQSSIAPKSVYGVHPGVLMVQKWISELPTKTGRSLDQWLALVERDGPASEKARLDWLKSAHGMGTNSAHWIAERAAGKNAEDSDPVAYLRAAEAFVEDMFAGPKAGLRPLYDRLLRLGLGIGKDVKACPCKTMVPLYRNHVFAQLKPTTRTRLDFGLALGKTKAPKRLLETGGATKGDRISHRIPITSPADIDAEVERWLRKAYELDA